MFNPTTETIEKVKSLYAKFAELDKEVEEVMKNIKPLADMEALDEDTETLIRYGDMLDAGFGQSLIASEELTCLLADNVG